MGQDQSKDENLQGYQFLRIQPNSPAGKAGLQVFFDFIIAANGVRLLQEDSTLVEQLQVNVEKPMVLTIFNSRSGTTRDVSVTPSTNWGGSGLLGSTIRFCSVEQSTEFVWHILDVHPNSPASQAGFEAQTDYIVGTSDLLFTTEEDLGNLVSSNLGYPVLLYVYSTKSENIRDVSLTPDEKWGGEGVLGCDVGFGYLHRVPLKSFLHDSQTLLTQPDSPLAPQPQPTAQPPTVAPAVSQPAPQSTAVSAEPEIEPPAIEPSQQAIESITPTTPVEENPTVIHTEVDGMK